MLFFPLLFEVLCALSSDTLYFVSCSWFVRSPSSIRGIRIRVMLSLVRSLLYFCLSSLLFSILHHKYLETGFFIVDEKREFCSFGWCCVAWLTGMLITYLLCGELRIKLANIRGAAMMIFFY